MHRSVLPLLSGHLPEDQPLGSVPLFKILVGPPIAGKIAYKFLSTTYKEPAFLLEKAGSYLFLIPSAVGALRAVGTLRPRERSGANFKQRLHRMFS